MMGLWEPETCRVKIKEINTQNKQLHPLVTLLQYVQKTHGMNNLKFNIKICVWFFSLQLFFGKFFTLTRNYRVRPRYDGLRIKTACCCCCCLWWWWWWWCSSAVIVALLLLSDICASDFFGVQHREPSEVKGLRKRESCSFRSVVYKLDVHCYEVQRLHVVGNKTFPSVGIEVYSVEDG